MLADYVPTGSGLREAAPLPEPWSVLEPGTAAATPVAETAASPEPAAATVDPAPAAIVAGPADLPHPAADLWLATDDPATVAQPVDHAALDPAQERHATG